MLLAAFATQLIDRILRPLSGALMMKLFTVLTREDPVTDLDDII